MEIAIYLFIAVVSVALGAGSMWFVNRARIRQSNAESKAAYEGERSRIETELKSAEQRIAELSDRLTRSEHESRRLQDERANEMARRSAAEEQARRIPELESMIAGIDIRLNSANTRLQELEAVRAQLSTALQKERESHQEKLRVIMDAQTQLGNSFAMLSAEALKNSNQSFLQMATETLSKFHEGAKIDLDHRRQSITEILAPVKDSLSKVDSKIHELEVSRQGAYEGLKQHLATLVENQQQLRLETSNLVRALRSPGARGRWGEVQLRRVIEMAGMLAHCDFCEQESVSTENGRLRPDVVVKLPAGRTIVVDAKVPLEAYLDAVEIADDDARRERMKGHSRQLRNHITGLSKKGYWDLFQPSPEFVVLFLPGEMFYSAALEHDPALIEYGVEQRVILATPTTLIALLRAVAYGWRQESLAENAHRISELGKELFERVSTMADHFARLGKSLSASVDSYNKAVGSVESRVLVTARRFKELSVTSAKSEGIAELVPIETSIRELASSELNGSEIRNDEALPVDGV
jgi:DNA recombination protein RmuC